MAADFSEDIWPRKLVAWEISKQRTLLMGGEGGQKGGLFQ